MNKLLLLGMLILSVTFQLFAQSTPLSSTLFIQQDNIETNQCIQIRRGDIITLTGKIEFISKKTESDKMNLFFTSLGGRKFNLKGILLPKITIFYKTLLETENITLTGTILFEGWEDIPAELEVSAFKPSEQN